MLLAAITSAISSIARLAGCSTIGCPEVILYAHPSLRDPDKPQIPRQSGRLPACDYPDDAQGISHQVYSTQEKSGTPGGK